MNPRLSTQPKEKVARERTQVEAGDLKALPAIHAILKTLNDPKASARPLAEDIVRVPVLEARIRAEYSRRFANQKGVSFVEQVALLGNRQLEALLLELLEDLTLLCGMSP